jgi:serine/threonine-protein kinase HipA
MSQSLVVLLGDMVAGTLHSLPNGRVRFEYEDEYREREAVTPLSLSMPTQLRMHTHEVVGPWLWGLLPDNDAVLRRWAGQFHVSASSAFSLLSSPVGEDCAGAVRFCHPDKVEEAIARSGTVVWLTDDEVGARIRELKRDSTAWLGRSFTGQFSLAGAQAKTALLFEDGRWGVPSGTRATSHILKPAVLGFDDHDLNEHLSLQAARFAGLAVAQTRIATFGGESAVVVTRYDRFLTDRGVLHRIHQEDVCQALSVHPSHKYQNEGGPTPGDVARLFRNTMPPSIADEATRRFADALIWNWLIAGTDAHAKNYSLLLSDGDVRLAPLYDIASALPYRVHEKKLRMAMKIGGDYAVSPGFNAWPKAAAELGLEPEMVVQRVRELASVAPDAYAQAAAAPEVVALNRESPSRLVSLVADRAARCARVVG